MGQASQNAPIDCIRNLGNNVQVGRFTYMDGNVKLTATHKDERIVIGNFCSIADEAWIRVGGNHRTDMVSTYPFDFFVSRKPYPPRTYQTTRPTVIGNDVWIGSRACILGGVRVGDGAVISMGAVVFKDVPPYAMVVGNPAQIVRYRFSKVVVERLLRLNWWDWPNEKIHANAEWFHRPVEEFLDHFDPLPT